MKEPKVIEIFADNGEHSHWQLIDKNGEILWSEEPTEVKNNSVLPLVSVSVAVEEILKPKYMNDIYAWKQVQDAINKATERQHRYTRNT